MPYGIYDVTANAGLVSAGITSDTAVVAICSLLGGWGANAIQRRTNSRSQRIAAARMARACHSVELQKLADVQGSRSKVARRYRYGNRSFLASIRTFVCRLRRLRRTRTRSGS